jgi:hypothetical protein
VSIVDDVLSEVLQALRYLEERLQDALNATKTPPAPAETDPAAAVQTQAGTVTASAEAAPAEAPEAPEAPAATGPADAAGNPTA